MLQCLKLNKNSELMDPKCKQMITKRQITQNTGEDQTHLHLTTVSELVHLILPSKSPSYALKLSP